MTGLAATLRIALVWLALLGLLAMTVGASFLPLGTVSPAVSYGIAAIKAGFIFWFYMEMRTEHPLPRLATVAAIVWMVILLTLTWTDYATRPPPSSATRSLPQPE